MSRRCRSVGLPSTDIVLFTKIAEGGSYRIFEATFRDGLKVIARLPYPSTIPREFGVASEVATMEFLRIQRYLAHLSLPGHVLPCKFVEGKNLTDKEMGSDVVFQRD